MGVWICQTYLYSCWTEWNLKNRKCDCEIESYDQSTKCHISGLMIGREWDFGTLEHLRQLVGDQELFTFLPLILWRAPTITRKPTHAQWKDCAQIDAWFTALLSPPGTCLWLAKEKIFSSCSSPRTGKWNSADILVIPGRSKRSRPIEFIGCETVFNLVHFTLSGIGL